MDLYIPKDEALRQLTLLRDGYELENKRAAASAVTNCLDVIGEMGGKQISTEPEEAPMTVAAEPWWKDALTGRDVYRCGRCTRQVDKKDRYCRFCGRKLIKKDGRDKT